MTSYRSGSVAFALGLAVTAGLASAQPSGGGAVARNAAEMQFAPIPGLPTCGTGAVQSGDPMKGEFIALTKIKTGCVVPWHWHSAGEHLMIVSGQAAVQMKGDAKPTVLGAGGFAQMPAKHLHQFRCLRTCSMYLFSDGAFDVHYVDPAGKEIPAQQALAPMHETAAMP